MARLDHVRVPQRSHEVVVVRCLRADWVLGLLRGSLLPFAHSTRQCVVNPLKGDAMSENRASAWAVGWSGFAGFMLIVAGIMQGINGLSAIFNDEFFVRLPNYTFRLDITGWGWIHLILGVVLVASGLGVFSGHLAGRIVGVVVAGLCAIANFMWLPYYPVWSSILIAVCVAIIWALTAHGRDIAATDDPRG